jgi:hypothetical protein
MRIGCVGTICQSNFQFLTLGCGARHPRIGLAAAGGGNACRVTVTLDAAAGEIDEAVLAP